MICMDKMLSDGYFDMSLYIYGRIKKDEMYAMLVAHKSKYAVLYKGSYPNQDNALAEWNSKIQNIESIDNEQKIKLTYEEACVLLTQKRNEKDYEFEIEVSLMIDSDRLFEDSRPTYTNIRKYVFDKYGVKLQLKDIADVKRDYGMKMKVNKHLIKGDEPVRRKCTPNKRKYIIEALKYYHAI